MPYRKIPLIENQTYHIFSKSINKLKIFPTKRFYTRAITTTWFYQFKNIPIRLSWYLDYLKQTRKPPLNFKNLLNNNNKLIQIVCYCFMPTHFHFILKQLVPNGISLFMGNILNSYARYFNLKNERKGAIFDGRFKNVLLKTDTQLLHLTRYIHLNPVTAYLVNKPENWPFSSYKEYLGINQKKKQISEFKNLLDIEPKSYKSFVEKQINYQRQLAEIKKSSLG